MKVPVRGFVQEGTIILIVIFDHRNDLSLQHLILISQRSVLHFQSAKISTMNLRLFLETIHLLDDRSNIFSTFNDQIRMFQCILYSPYLILLL